MSKRTVLFLALGAFLLPFLAGGILLFLAPDLNPFGDPVFTDEIPAKRPKRPDRRLLERHAGKNIGDILAEVKAANEAAVAEDPGSVTPPSAPPAILAMLPEAPLPFPDEAVPRDEAGLKSFVTTMKAGPGAGPSTAEERWQFNLALAGLGVKPSDVPEAIREETRPAAESDTFPVRLLRHEVDLRGPVALGDFDGEDGPEIAAAGGSTLFKVEAAGALVPLDGLAENEPGRSLHPADFDGDGHLDLYVARGEGLPDSLLRNTGGGHFVDETVARGLLAFGDTTAAAWLDYDRDGLPDLLVGSRDRPLELYHQTAAGLFQPVAWDLKLWVPRGIAALATFDADGDAFPDLALARGDGRVRILLSRPSVEWNGWRFEDCGFDAAFPSGKAVSALAVIDADRDGRTDLVVATAEPDPALGSLRLLRNEGQGAFADLTVEAGLRLEGPVQSLAVVDIDRDGFDDLFVGTPDLVTDRVFRNREGAGYAEVSVTVRASYVDGTVAASSGDLGGNGSADLLLVNGAGRVRWLEADGADDHWLRVAVPRYPPGTRIVLAVRDPDWVLRNCEGRLGADSSLTLGIGGADKVERLEVWSIEGGESPLKTLESLEPDRLVVVDLPPPPAKRAVTPVPAPTVVGDRPE